VHLLFDVLIAEHCTTTPCLMTIPFNDQPRLSP